MTSYDVRNYLEKIYKIPVVNVQTRVVCGEIKRVKDKAYMIKDDDYREALVDLVSFLWLSNSNSNHFVKPKHVRFEYPQIYTEDRETIEDEAKKIEKQIGFIKNKERRRLYSENRNNVPSWFGI